MENPKQQPPQVELSTIEPELVSEALTSFADACNRLTSYVIADYQECVDGNADNHFRMLQLLHDVKLLVTKNIKL